MSETTNEDDGGPRGCSLRALKRKLEGFGDEYQDCQIVTRDEDGAWVFFDEWCGLFVTLGDGTTAIAMSPPGRNTMRGVVYFDPPLEV